MSPFKILGLDSAVESFGVFLVAGFLVVTGGNLFVDITADLPDWYASLIQEPISIAYFFILSIFGLLVTAAVTRGGTRDVVRKWWFRWFVLAPSKGGLSCGAIASGMLLGIGAGLFVVTRGSPVSELAETSRLFMWLGVYCIAIVYPVTLLMAYLIDVEQRHKVVIDVLGGVYVLLVIYSAFNLKEHLDWIGLMAEFAVIIVWAVIGRWIYKRPAKNAMQPTPNGAADV